MKPSIRILIVSMMALISSSCGVRFTQVTPNLGLPESYQQRTIFPGGVAIYAPEDVAGAVLVIKENQPPFLGGKIFPAGATAKYVPLTADASLNYYNSKITKGAEAQGSYLSFAASFSAGQMAELEMVDIGYVALKLDPAQYADLKRQAQAWILTNPKDPSKPEVRRVWVKSVVLTSRRFTSSTEISANASGVATPAVKVGGKVYSTSNVSIRSVIMAFEAYDIDELAGAVVTAGDVEDVFKQFKAPMRVNTVVGTKDDPSATQESLAAKQNL